MKLLRVGVLMGGMSIEKEVSFNSGRTVCDHLDTTRYSVVPIFQRDDGALFILPYAFLHRGKIADFVDRLETEAQKLAWDDLSTYIDFMYIATHGRFAEDGILQGTLEVLGIPYLGSKIYASALCMDKHAQKHILRAYDIATPHSITLTPHEITNLALETIIAQMTTHNLLFPCVVKPHKEGSSLGIRVVHTADELKDALMHACFISSTPQQVLIEEYMRGMEFSCIILIDPIMGNYLPLPPTEVVPEDGTLLFDYEQKYMPGRAHKFTPPRCSPETIKAIHHACIQTMHALDMTTIARIDGFVNADGIVYITDPNTFTGMGPASFLFREAAEMNMSHSYVINHLIDTELRSYGIHYQAPTHEGAETNNYDTNTPKIRIAVLLGGDSHEREISLESGRNVVYKLAPHRYEIVPLFVNEQMQLFHIDHATLVRNSTKEIEMVVSEKQRIRWDILPTIVDFVFIGLHGGKGENGAVQGMLEMLHLPYNGSSVLTSALCMNKHKTAEVLRMHGIDTPKQVLVSSTYWHTHQNSIIDDVTHALGFPVIVKPHDDGCSVLVQKAHNEEELKTYVHLVFASGKSHALIEEYITGMELTVGVLGNNNPRALPPSYAVASTDILSITEKFLPGAGQNITPAPLPKETLIYIQHIIEQTYKAAGCVGYARIDCFYQSAAQSPTQQERVVILEINTLPGLTPATCFFHQAAELGITPMECIDLIVQLGFAHHAHMIKNNTIHQSMQHPWLETIR